MKKTLNRSLASAELHAVKPIRQAARHVFSLLARFEGGFVRRMVFLKSRQPLSANEDD